MRSAVRRQGVVLVAACVLSSPAVLAQSLLRTFTYDVSPRPVISVRNPYGKISVKPGTGNQVIATVACTDRVAVQGEQNGNMVRFSAQQVVAGQASTADYELQVPEEATIIVTSSSGSITVWNVTGDLVFESAESAVSIQGISHSHIHIKTLGGSVSVTNVSDSHLEVSTISGNVELRDIRRAVVSVHSGSGHIQFVGDPGGGLYEMKSHTGDIDVTLPVTASAGVSAKAVKGQVENSFPVEAKRRISLLPRHSSGLMHNSGPTASFVLNSYSGNIHARQH
jgi:hypothetical protein